MRVCTVLPTYNERDNIEPLIRRLLAAVEPPYMILVVDDDSPDKTWQVVDAIAAEVNFPGDPRLILIRRMGESGLTSAIQRGIDEAIHTHGADAVTWMDCDLSMPPEELPGLLALLHAGADVAAGSRWIPGGADVAHGAMARGLSWIINHFASLLLGGPVTDWTSGFMAAKAPVLRAIRLRGDYGEYCIDLLGRAVKAGFVVKEAPYQCVPRLAGESKTGINLWDYLIKGRKYFGTIVRLRFERN
ncbi:MAG: polyprenol monophosphomannose synthase [Caldilineaceae bacterium]|nr:polyprenol monophosphomannose synthase [Caldilineaceae bacterium]MBP8108623.1 polyprenol monophosphomannose synthase [Caldilineaceae bacterium]MBP8123176.1 polyprenol monophosphomannose synthase [Caldilineaceae bacterium]MBP9072398.1 polyprenol monophosphomannose synthase [Caldilineaceae bacterium]